MREKIIEMEMGLGISSADTSDPEVFVGAFLDQEQTARRKRSRTDDSKGPAVENDEDGEVRSCRACTLSMLRLFSPHLYRGSQATARNSRRVSNLWQFHWLGG